MTPVSIRGLQKSYDGKTPVLDGIDLEIAAGELFFLLGKSGCGKTTLLRLLAGFIHADQGRILFEGKDVSGIPTEERDIGMVFQSYALWPHLSVEDNVGFSLEVKGAGKGECKKRVEETLALVELEGFGRRRIGELSGGQQQRVALARAIIAKPKVLLLDEPLSNLDFRLRGEMRRSIRRVCKAAGVTAVYVTHDQNEALSTADRIALLVEGRVEQVGTPRELYESPRTEAVARFVGEANILTASQAMVLGITTGAGRFCLRPERIRLGTAGVPGQILEGSYQGDRAFWTVRVHDLTLNVVETAPPVRQSQDAVFLQIDARDLVALR